MEPSTPTTFIADLKAELEIPKDGTLSRVLYKDDQIRLVLFGFDADQELTEHTASLPAVLQIISGRAEITLGSETISAEPGCWIHMEANLPHSVVALEPTVLLLTLLKHTG